MGKLYNGSIPIEQVFKFQQDAPLEDRVAVKTKEDLSLIRPYKGLLTYVEEERAYYSYTENEQGEYEWQKANLGGLDGESTPVLTSQQIQYLYENQKLPENYINIGDPTIQGSPVSNTISIQENSGDYRQIIFSAIRALQSEVAKLKNTFYYGIRSLNNGQTAGSEIINSSEEEEAEPLWAYDPEDLSEITDLSLDINGSCQLTPSSNFTYSSDDNFVNIIDQVSTESIDTSLIDVEDNQSPTKFFLYSTIEPTDDNWEFIINFKDGSSLNLHELDGVKKQKCNIMFIVSRRVPLVDDPNTSIGKCFYYLSITNIKGDLVYSKYLNDVFIPSSSEINLVSTSLIDTVILNKIKLFKLSFYVKFQSFSNDYDLVPEKATTDDFVYQASHITLRSVSSYDYLVSIKDRLLQNEPIFVTDPDPSLAGLYFKTKTNTLYKIGGSSQNPDDSGMTQEAMINWLLDNNLIVGSAENGYELNADNIDFSKIDADKLSFTGVTLVNEDTQIAYELSVDYKGELQCKQVDYAEIPADPDAGYTGNEDDASRYGYRGAAALKTLGSKIATTTASEVSNVEIINNEVVIKALGDRIRFGSWYIPNKNQNVFNCSHDFIEIVNSGSFNYSLKDAILGVIYRNDVPKEEDENLYGKHYSIEEFPITGNIAAGSSYLIRGLSRKPLKNSRVKITEFDQEIDFDFVNNDCAGLLLYHRNLSGHLTTVDENQVTILRELKKAATGNFNFQVDMRLLDAITFGSNEKNLVTKSSSGAALYTDSSYKKTNDHIGKDQYILDPARQGFRSLTTSKYESTNCRLSKVQSEEIPLGEDVVSFPHSANIISVEKYTPKASYQHKNVLTDKTSPDFTKPNMVTCSFGMNAATTRCFNWFSMSKNNEYVWIRKVGDITWNRFESYKSTDGTTSPVADSSTKMHRKEFAKSIIQSVYARIDNVFPGDETFAFRAHKCVVYIQPEMTDGDPVTYEYCVGASDTQGLPVNVGPFDIQTFTIYPLDWKPRVYQTTDQQGFGWMEYQEWAAAAEELNQRIIRECTPETKEFPVFINTGDMTQNGTRVNEWMDYYNAGKCLFTHLEQMNVVGNNDLCNAYSEKVLGNGDDNGKSSPYYFHVFYCYEIPNEIVSDDPNWSNPVIFNGVYVPSMYYFYFGTYGYLMVNSELTATTCNVYFKQNENDYYYNLYTGYLSNSTTQLTSIQPHFLGDTLNSWLTILKQKAENNTKKIIVACHEMPFTVTTRANLMTGNVGIDRSISGSSLVGSHLNVLGPSDNFKIYDYTYWFSNLLQTIGIKLCIGGHKHTYAVTYPVADLSNGNTSDKVINNYHFSKKTKINRNSPISFDTIDSDLWDYDTTITNGVVYFMCQATGYKQKSNKELPDRGQGYSKIVPETSGWNAAGDSATADVSQTYPMYVVYSYEEDKIIANLYRVINIKKESIDSQHKAKVTEFSETAFSTNKMYSEKLVISKEMTTVDNEEVFTGFYKNYWFVDNDFLTISPGISGGNVVDQQRCRLDNLENKTYLSCDASGASLTRTMESNNTIEI